jgi:hypothetical protein
MTWGFSDSYRRAQTFGNGRFNNLSETHLTGLTPEQFQHRFRN